MKNFFAIIAAVILVAVWLSGNLLKMSGNNPSLIFTKENILKTVIVGLAFLAIFYLVNKFKGR